MRDNSYTYVDPDGIYTYPNSDVLINLFDLRAKEELSAIEHKKTASKLLELVFNPIMVSNCTDIRKIHKYLFGEIYWWAGEYRKVNISKSGKQFIATAVFNTAEIHINSLLQKLLESDLNREEIVVSLAEILDNLNYFHPFREGNGRTQREVVRVLALAKGYECLINISSDPKIYELYMLGTVNGDIDMLNNLFNEVLTEI